MSSTSFLSGLKLKLQYFSSELQNITIDDLLQLKWLQKQKIILSLVQQSQFLHEFHDKIVEIMERKNRKISKWKENNSKDKQLKLEIESDFRTDIMRVFVEGLEKLRWNRCFEAFSDPLGELLSNNEVFLEAVDYALGIELDSIRGESLPVPDVEESESVSESHTKNTNPSPKARRTTSSSSRSSSMVKDVSLSVPNSARTEISEIDNVQISQSIGSVYHSKQQSFMTNERPTTNRPSPELSMDMIERLQHQNQLLTKKLQAYEESFRRREEIEGMMYNLIVDLKLSVQQMMELSSTEERSELLPKDVKDSIPASSRSINSVSQSGMASKPSWKKLSHKIESMEKEWHEIQTRLRQMKSNANSNHKNHHNSTSIHHNSREPSFSTSFSNDATAALENQLLSLHPHELQKDLIELHFNFQKLLSPLPSLKQSKSSGRTAIKEKERVGKEGNRSDSIDRENHLRNQLQRFFDEISYYEKIWRKSQEVSMKLSLFLTSDPIESEIDPDVLQFFNSQHLGTTTQYQEAMERLQQLLHASTKGSSGNPIERTIKTELPLVMTAITHLYLHHKTIIRSYTQLSTQLDLVLTFLQHWGQNYQFFYLKNYSSLLENSYESISERLHSVTKAGEIFDLIDREIRVSLPSSQNSHHHQPPQVPSTKVNPIDAISRGIFGKEMATLIELLRSHRSQWISIPMAIQEIYQQERERFQKNINEYKDMMNHLTNFRRRKSAIDEYLEETLSSQYEYPSDTIEDTISTQTSRRSYRNGSAGKTTTHSNNRSSPAHHNGSPGLTKKTGKSAPLSLADRPPFDLSLA